jgi:hypothetical protein
MKSYLTKFIPHIVGILLFIIVASLYGKPVFDGYGVNQADVVNHKGMANDIVAFREVHDNKEPLWTDGMFGGMPATQISVAEQGNFNAIYTKILSLGLPHPADVLFLYFIGFFILALCFRVNPWIAVVGALVFGFSSYYIIIIEAGHNSKSFAIAYMAPVIGAFYLAYRRNLVWGVLLSMFFMMMQIGANHLQITYYLGFLLVALGVHELIHAWCKKEMKRFGMATIGVLFAYALAGLSTSANLFTTSEYAKETIRGKNNLTITPDLKSNSHLATDGLDKDYITQWSYGKSESLTLMIPYAKGGETTLIGNGEFAEKLRDSDLTRTEKEFVSNSLQYWGDQPFTSGPVYVGALTFLLAVLGLFFIQSSIKWPLFIITLLTLFLSWGKNMMWLTNLFLDYLPMYSKFRAVTIILVILELCIPILAILFLHQLFENKSTIVAQKKKFFIVSGSALAIVLFLAASPSITGLFSTSEMDKMSDPQLFIGQEVRQQIKRIPAEQLAQYGVQNPNNPQEVEQFTLAVIDQQVTAYENNIPALKSFRGSIFSGDTMRSFGFMLFGLLLILLYLLSNSINKYIMLSGVGALMVFDLVSFDLKYLGQEGKDGVGGTVQYKHWIPMEEKLYPHTPKESDLQILESEMARNPELSDRVNQVAQQAERYAREKEFTRTGKTNYVQRERFRVYREMTRFRVADYTDPMFSSSRAAYFHRSLGGYHGAKLQRYQNLIEFDFIPYDQQIVNMLNTKYIVQQTGQGPAVRENPKALGNAWLTKKLIQVETEDEEILHLGKKYTISAENNWKLRVNDDLISSGVVYGREEVIAYQGADSVLVQWPDGLAPSEKAFLVQDVNGNVNWIPEVVASLDTLNSFTKLVSLEVIHNFVPAQMTIINNEYKDFVSNSDYTAEGTINLVDHRLDYLKYEFNSQTEQLAVFSEIYYPAGWRAKIDGKEVEHLRVNYILRGLKVPAGNHIIEFELNDDTYQKGITVARISSWLVLLILIGGVVFQLYRTKKSSEVA